MERTLIAARDADVTVITPKPGESIEPEHAPPPRRWWPDVPFRTVDEAPAFSSGLTEADRLVDARTPAPQ